MDKVHKGKRPKFNMYNFVDEIFIRGEECNAPVKKNKKMEVRFFGVPCAPPTPLSPTTHSHKYPSLSLAGYHSFTFFFLTNTTNTPLSLSHPLPPVYLIHHHLHHHFLARSPENPLEPLSTFIYFI